MNIFVTDENPLIAAKHLDDRRVIQMILEAAQMMTSALVANGIAVEDLQYKPTHKNHPCTVWAGESWVNFLWVREWARMMNEQYKRVSGKDHVSFQAIREMPEFVNILPDIEQTPFRNCTSDCKHIKSITKAYRTQMCLKWARDSFNLKPHLRPKWTYNETPDFWLKHRDYFIHHVWANEKSELVQRYGEVFHGEHLHYCTELVKGKELAIS